MSILCLALALTVVGANDSPAQAHCARVPVRGMFVNVCVTGDGPETVVLAAGAGQSSLTWTALATELSSEATVVSFDRPGFGQSDRGAPPRTPRKIAEELDVVLSSTGVTSPYVLVGHSMGGLHILQYASLKPDMVAGVVLLDTPPPGFEEKRMELLSETERGERRQMLANSFLRMGSAARLEKEGAGDSSEWDLLEFPVDVPIVVIVADSQDFGHAGSQAAHRTLWIEESRQWLVLSDSSQFVVAEGSGHMVHHERVDLVTKHVRRLLRGR